MDSIRELPPEVQTALLDCLDPETGFPENVEKITALLREHAPRLAYYANSDAAFDQCTRSGVGRWPSRCSPAKIGTLLASDLSLSLCSKCCRRFPVTDWATALVTRRTFL